MPRTGASDCGRFSGNGRLHNWVAADLFFVKDGILMARPDLRWSGYLA
jgi:hypothetical protein